MLDITKDIQSLTTFRRQSGHFMKHSSSSTTSKLSMAYLVNLTARVQRDLAQLYYQIDAGSSDASLKWYRGLQRAILSLEQHPNRCAVTPEIDKLRHLLYGNLSVDLQDFGKAKAG